MMNKVLGGEFTARINMNLREDKHWAYGAYSFVIDALGQRPFLAYAPVQTDKTVESMLEIKKEFTDVVSTRPPTAEEFKKVQENEILQLPGSWETINSVMGSISNIVRYGYDNDYYQKYPEKIRTLKLQTVQTAAKEVVKPENLVWVIVGDREKIEDSIKNAGFDNIRLLNPDGKMLTSN